MTDAPITPEAKSKTLGFIIPVVLVIALISAVGYIIANSGLDKAAVAKAVDGWASSIAQRADKNGGVMAFTYGDIEMAGGASNRYAILKDAKLQIGKKTPDKPEDVITIATSSLELHPKSIRMNRLMIKAAEPVQITEDDGVEVNVISSEPLIFHGERMADDAGAKLLTQLELPTQLTFENPKRKDNIVLKMDKGASFSGTMLESDSNVGESSFDVRNINISASSTKEALSLAEFSAVVNSAKASADAYKVSVISNLIDVNTLNTQELPFGKMSLRLNGTYTGPMPKDGEPINFMQNPVHLKIEKLELAAETAGLGLQADLKTTPKELIPVTNAKLQVQNFAAIRDYAEKQGAFSKSDTSLYDAIFRAVLGTKFTETQDIDLTITREEGGQMKIGNSTLEELMAVALTGAVLAPQPVPQPEAPVDPIPEISPAAPVVQPENME